jgi:integrase
MALTFERRKDGEPYTVPLHPRVLSVLQPLPDDPEAYLLSRRTPEHLSRAFRMPCEAQGISDFHFHDLRHDAGAPSAWLE